MTGLTSGTNWSGTIRHFHPATDKDTPGNLVSFRMDVMRERSPTRIAVR